VTLVIDVGQHLKASITTAGQFVPASIAKKLSCRAEIE
jgi:hypothetical protein